MAVPVDEFPVDYQSTRFPGWLRVGTAGSGCHIAQTLRALGNDVRLCTVVGNDLPGAFVRAQLYQRGLLGPGTVKSQGSTLGVVLVAADGQRMGQPYLAMANTVLIADVDDDYNRPWLEVADIVFCSHERLRETTLAGWVRQVFHRYPGCAIAGVGCGSAGCVLGLRDGRLISVPAVAPRGVVSTAGAGDTLFASFLHGWLATGNPVRAIERAVLQAG